MRIRPGMDCGMALGHAGPAALNTLVAGREPVTAFARLMS